jgi:ribosomal protein S18 acetylase RimI-like enzyme
MTIRKGRLADVNAIVTLEETLFPRDYPISQRNLARFVHSPTAKMIVVEDAGQIAGCAIVLFRCRSAIARVYTIGVVSSHRGRGIGSKLLQAAERAAVARHCAFIRLEVRPGNKRAIRLYRTHGYRKFGRHANYYPDGADALRLEKHLAPRRKPLRRTSATGNG